MMKKNPRQWLGGIAIAFLLAMMIPVTASACIATDNTDLEAYEGAWKPTDETVFAMQYSSKKNSQAFIYDFGAPETKLELFEDARYTNIYFTEFIEDGVSTWYADTVKSGQTLLLGEDANFGIAFSKDGESWIDYYVTGESGAYALLDSNMNTALLIHDAETVHTPIPGAALLLGSGLFGLAAARRKSRQA